VKRQQSLMLDPLIHVIVENSEAITMEEVRPSRTASKSDCSAILGYFLAKTVFVEISEGRGLTL